MCHRMHGADSLASGCECVCNDVSGDPSIRITLFRVERVCLHWTFRLASLKETLLTANCIFSEQSQRIFRLGIRSALLLGLAIVCWLVDRFCCDTWWGASFPYLHAMWHVLIFISSYTACVLFAYYAAKEEHVDRVPDLRYWPVNNFELGIPFVSIKCYYTTAKDHNI